jgi:ubiquitin conjugation factor E4 B
LAQFEARLAKAKQEIDDMWSTIHATHGVLLDELNQARSMQLMRYIIVWLLRIASGQNIPKEKLKLPLSTEQSPVFQSLPEYFLEDIVENFKFIVSNVPQIITPQQSEEILQVCITFLRHSEYVKNPGVKSGLVSILFYGAMPYGNRSRGVLGDVLIGSEFAHQHLLHALMKFYIEAESTGSHTQFYDKFNIRYEIFQVVKAIWVNTLYRENLAKEARINTDFFVQFVNMLVNDATFVLDEALTSFSKIKQLTDEISDPSIMADLTEEQRKEKTDLLEDHKGKAKSYMQLTRESMETLKLFTETLADAFTMKEIVTRLADMLDYNLDTLVGAKRSQLRVQGAQEYGFNPPQLVSDLVRVYVNLSTKESFITAIARDGRSYKPTNFTAATEILQRFALASPDELQKWESLGVAVAATHAQDLQDDEDLGEIPDEFLDPLVFDLMTDPVILPRSKNSVDRSTIRSHLLSDPTDPFNRTPLKIEDVIPDTDLKEKIEAWKRERKEEKRKERARAVEAETEGKMDTSEG